MLPSVDTCVDLDPAVRKAQKEPFNAERFAPIVPYVPASDGGGAETEPECKCDRHDAWRKTVCIMSSFKNAAEMGALKAFCLLDAGASSQEPQGKWFLPAVTRYSLVWLVPLLVDSPPDFHIVMPLSFISSFDFLSEWFGRHGLALGIDRPKVRVARYGAHWESLQGGKLDMETSDEIELKWKTPTKNKKPPPKDGPGVLAGAADDDDDDDGEVVDVDDDVKRLEEMLEECLDMDDPSADVVEVLETDGVLVLDHEMNESDADKAL